MPTRWCAARSFCPHGLGKSKKVLVSPAATSQEAEQAGADYVRRRRDGRENQQRELTDFDALIANSRRDEVSRTAG